MTAIDSDKAAELAQAAAPRLTETQFVAGLDIAERLGNAGSEKYQQSEEKAESVDALRKRLGKVAKLKKFFQNPAVTGITGGIAGAFLTAILMSEGDQPQQQQKTETEVETVSVAVPCNSYSAPSLVRQSITGSNYLVAPANYLLNKSETVLKGELEHIRSLAQVGPLKQEMQWDCDPQALNNGRSIVLPVLSLPANASDELIEALGKMREDMNSRMIKEFAGVVTYRFSIEGQNLRLVRDINSDNADTDTAPANNDMVPIADITID